MPDPARLRAVHRLLRIEEDGAFVSRVNEPTGADVERRAIALVAGVTRWKRWLDWVLAQYVRQPLASLDPELRESLRLGAFELLVEEKPAHAAVGEAVGVTRALLHTGAAGLANAVLRKVARARDEERPLAPETDDLANDLAVRHSHPTWMVRRWLARWGEDATLALLRAHNTVPTFSLRVNPLRTTPEAAMDTLAERGAEPALSRWASGVVTVRRLGPALQSALVARGHLAVQDEAAALVVRVLDPQAGEAILDGAAAPGGKAIAAAEWMGNEGRVVAVDVNEAKTRLIATAAEAHGTTIVEPLAADLQSFEPGEMFDRVLLDAPCSGTGVLAKRADLRWRRSPEALADLARLQDDLLDAAARLVRPGGLLVYSTCSLERDENEDRVDAFLLRHPEFTHEAVGETVPEEMRTPEGNYTALPHVHGTDGAFAARLRRSPDA
ncbi:MAG: 16S rRNA (cytosine(967)-C(5))-methyltransferase RsmB [Bacteroidota bacterium]